MSRIFGALGSGIGLATEAYAHRKASRSRSREPGTDRDAIDNGHNAGSSREIGSDRGATPTAYDAGEYGAPPPAYSETGGVTENDGHLDEEDESDDEDEEAWHLDEAGEEEAGRNNNEDLSTADGTIQSFFRDHPPPSYSDSTVRARLPCPVILPQRRPQNRSRGFVRAYAPVLNDCGIDQATFLDFLKTFSKSSQASPWFIAINVAAFGVGFIPSMSAQIAAMVTQVATEIAKRTQSRHRTNSFLEEINEKLFKPHGLYCLIMTYKPSQKASVEPVDLSETVMKAFTKAPEGFKGKMYDLRMSSGKTRGELEMPEAAPLIYPELDKASDAQKKNALKRSGAFVADYFDRRGQATYAAENPDSSLAAPPTQAFASRYADPNHPATSGGLLGLVTGGSVSSMRGGRKGRRGQRMQQFNFGGGSGSGQGGKGDGMGGQDGRGGYGGGSGGSNTAGGAGGKAGGLKGNIKRLLKENVLYLLIVNMPTQEEMDQAAANAAAAATAAASSSSAPHQ
ncbi:MAG: hypothetical protein M1827_001564 [Pycnora praestabilis]|nr:MAG: hypothetical protein M1827_001564 [Pycnora praestabilis]